MTHLLHKELTYYLRGLGFRIHKALGGGHPEANYETAVAAGLDADHVPYLRQHTYHIYYRNQPIGEYCPDFTLANGALQLDLKATPQITSLHKAQLLSSLAVASAELSFIMNFGARSMQYERLPNFLSSRERSPLQRPLDPKLLHPALTKQVLDALYTVYVTLGTGFWHKVYRRATCIELAEVGGRSSFCANCPWPMLVRSSLCARRNSCWWSRRCCSPRSRLIRSPPLIRKNCVGRNRSQVVNWRSSPISRRRSWMSASCESNLAATERINGFKTGTDCTQLRQVGQILGSNVFLRRPFNILNSTTNPLLS